ncbi:MAG: glycoside hydrolase family 3 protein [Deltaproteobacteria bacterium]|nr:glycoside hydrolase family 3 protein [Deltaproteobacteria bacterium]
MNIANFTLEQLAGQRIMAGFEGTELNSDLKFLIDTLRVGGLILFSGNLSNPEQIKKLCSSAQSYAASCGQPPLFIAIDQEGGEVARLKEPFTQFSGNPHMKSEKDAKEFATIAAEELSGVRINMNMAPVIDVAYKGVESVMKGRAFGDNPAWVSKMGVTVIKHLQGNGIMAVAKHFPGIGRTTLDSHIDMPFLKVDSEALFAFDLPPFEAAINNGVAGIMLSHILYSGIDTEWPASLSIVIAKDLLRRKMGFDGLVMTDDIDMGSIAGHYDIKIIIKQILLADIDLVLVCHKGPWIESAFNEILRSMEQSQPIVEAGRKSVSRIMRQKERFLF